MPTRLSRPRSAVLRAVPAGLPQRAGGTAGWRHKAVCISYPHHRVAVAPLIDRIYPLAEGLAAVAHASRPGTLKIMLHM